jgi:hypothetical protein
MLFGTCHGAWTAVAWVAVCGWSLAAGCKGSDADDGTSSSSSGATDSGPSTTDVPGTTGDPGSDSDATTEGGMDVPDVDDPDVTCLSPPGDSSVMAELSDGAELATVTVHDADACHRSYTLSTTQALRYDLPDNPRTVAEQSDAPTLRTGNPLLDGLYAMTLEEVRECSVDAIQDWGFNDGAPVACGEGGCFETGRLWNYVWTRDTAYAVDLGLAALDPTRARNSLEFKLSERRGGGNLQIVQDTGTGGSYPVSSDRVAWAVGAWELYVQLDGDARAEFGARAYEALSNTLEHDRAVVYDPADGLYFGEQSFLDWREQSYPDWTADDVVHIGMSKALGTNLLHFRAMEVAAALAEATGDTAARDRYAGWATALRQAIRDRLWLQDDGLFSTFTTTALDPSPTRQFDLLGSAFAVIFGVADASQASSILSRYPHYGPGAPVIWPQQQLTPIYHNRGEWPFVTAYWLRAAKVADHDAVADRMVHALVRGAALNLSNMENFEAASGSPWRDEGEYSGPVVNSQRQLWSVAAFVSMVHHTLFGLEADSEGLAVRPYLTRGLRNDLFADTDQIILNDVPYRGRLVSAVIHLPPVGGQGGPYPVGEIALDGVAIDGDVIEPDDLREHSRIDVHLVDEGDRAPRNLETRPDAQWQQIFGPRSPRITSISDVGGLVRLALSTGGEATGDVGFAIYRDGVRVAELPGTATTWDDPASNTGAALSPCYALETCFSSSGNCSQHSPPMCWFGAGNAAIGEFDADELVANGGSPSTEHGMFHYENWGAAGHTLELPSFVAQRTGEHLVQVLYGNGAGAIDTGITCAVKRVVVTDLELDSVAGEGVLVMPHLGTWDRWENSSFVPVELESGRAYRITVEGGPTAVNMSVFAHFEAYTAGSGGSGGAYNFVNIATLKVLAR